MKKKYLIIICLAAFFIVTLSGLVFLKSFIGKRYDFVIESKDYLSYFSFKNACSSERSLNYSRRAFTADLANPESFFNDYVLSKPSYLYSVDESNQRSQEATGNYLFFEDNHYYYVSVRDGKIYGVELAVLHSYTYDGMKGYSSFANFPFVGDELHIKGGFGSLQNENDDNPDLGIYVWNESVGLNSFEDIVEFYERIPDFELEKDQKNMTVSFHVKSVVLIDGYLKIIECPDMLRIKVTDDKIIAEYLKSDEK